MMRRLQLLIAFLIAAFALQAQIPSGYYNNAANKTGDELKVALHNIIKDHTKIGYDNLWNAYGTTDLDANGKIWDIYSNYRYTLGTNQCGTYKKEGDCYNREHLWAQSWTNSDNTEKTDLHHVFPTDGYVNNQRGNYPFGEVSSPTYTSGNGGKLGPNTVNGYNGIVFEPVDEYKGDIARALMYVSVRYYSEDSGWSTEYGMTNKSVIKDWAIAMLLDWNDNDPVSDKEIARNEAVYDIQHNRNPFIDNSDYAHMIWDPNWSGGNYTIYATANPTEGGTAYIDASVNETASIDFSEKYSSTTNLNGVNIAIDDNAKVVFNKNTGSSDPTYYTTGTAVRAYGGNNFVVSTTLGSITQIVLTYGSSDGSNTITTNVGSFSNATWTGSASSVTFTIASGSGNRRIKAIEVTYENEGSPVQHVTVASGTTVTLTATANEGYHFVNWTKGNTVVSTNATFNLTVTSNGTYQANFEENTSTIIVAAGTGGSAYIGDSPMPSPVTTSVTFSQKYSSDTELNGVTVAIDSQVSVTFNKGTGSNVPKYYANGTAARCYGGNNFVVNAGSYTITSITLTYGGSDGSNTITTNVDTFTSPTWTGSASSVTFTIGGSSGNRRISGISVTYLGGTPSPTTQADFTSGATATITASPNADYSFVNWTKNGVHVSGNATYSFTVTESATYTANFMSNTVSSDKTIASLTLNGTVTVNSGKTLTVTGIITQPEGTSISILNGGQLICNNSVYVKMQKNITAWDGSNGWYAIASPVNGQAFGDVTNLTTATHNIYRYDEAEIEWEEYRDSHNIFNSFENGRGYLFRTANTGGMIEFKGDNNVDAFNYDLSYICANNNFKGFNLIGNPYTQNITWANLVKTDVATDGYYILEESGTNQGKWTLVTSSSATIAPMRAFLVQATGSNPSVSISRTTSKEDDRAETDNIIFSVSNSQYSDEAYVMFRDGHGLNKIEHRNAEIPMLYVIDSDQHFAIADVDDNTNVVNLGFEAKTMGQYTLKLKADGDFSCLHLIDRITGEDVDMLIEDEYSFIAAPSDVKNRFVVKCRCNSAANADDDIFAYQNGDDIIVEGNGLLQIFDVTGRIVVNKNVNGVEIIGKPTRSGLYVFRLVGEDVKTQKIVVK